MIPFLTNQNRGKKKGTSSFVDKNYRDLVDKSSEINRNLGLIFVGFLSYLLITVNGISDLQLLVLDKGIQLPIVGISLPILPFAYVTPLVIFGIHLNLLLNLREHSSKLNHWRGIEEAKGSHVSEKWIQLQLHPFLFNHIHNKDGGIFSFLTRLLVTLFAFFVPLFCLFYIQYRFSDLHDLSLTYFHFSCFFADALLIMLSYPEILCEHKITFRLFLVHSLFPIRFGYQIVKSFQSKSGKGIWKSIQILRLLDQATFWSISALSILYLIVVWALCEGNRFKAILAYTNGYPYNYVIQLLSDSSFHSQESFESYVPATATRKFPDLPVLDINGEKIAISTPSITEIQTGMKRHFTEDSILVKYTKGIQLSHRDLKFARFIDCEFINAVLTEANFQGANLAFSNFQNANLSEANLQNTNLYKANFRRARLCYTNIKRAILTNANFQNADLLQADLQNIKSIYTDFQNANLSFANLQNTGLWAANFQNVNLTNANLQNARLPGTDLRSADLSYTKIQNADLSEVQFQYSKMHHVNLSHSNISGADFSEAKFINDTVTGVFFREASIRFPYQRMKWEMINGRTEQIIR